MDRSLEVEVPGVFAKRLIAATADQTITTEDCKTLQGITKDTKSRDVVGRYLAVSAGTHSRNTLVTPQVQDQLLKKRIRTIKIRSPLTCEATEGLWATPRDRRSTFFLGS